MYYCNEPEFKLLIFKKILCQKKLKNVFLQFNYLLGVVFSFNFEFYVLIINICIFLLILIF